MLVNCSVCHFYFPTSASGPVKKFAVLQYVGILSFLLEKSLVAACEITNKLSREIDETLGWRWPGGRA